MPLFGRRRNSSDRRGTRDNLSALREWAVSRRGVEAFVEPRTSSSEPTVVLVAADGESMRRRVPSAKAAADFARKAGIPVYDANLVGYPQRMRDHAVQKKAAQEARSRTGAARSRPASPTQRPLSSAERDALVTLQVSAGVEAATGRPGDEVLQKWWKQARSRSHPDRRGGDRTEWDEVEQAARVLGLR